MAEDAHERTMRELRDAVAEYERCQDVRDRLAEAIVGALKAGVRPRDVDDVVPYDRNHVRRIARAAGVAPLRESTVRPRDKDA